MADIEFKEGDTVKIKSKGESPIMVVDIVKIIPITNRKEVYCKWFNNKEQKWETEIFNAESLIHFSPR